MVDHDYELRLVVPGEMPNPAPSVLEDMLEKALFYYYDVRINATIVRKGT